MSGAGGSPTSSRPGRVGDASAVSPAARFRRSTSRWDDDATSAASAPGRRTAAPIDSPARPLGADRQRVLGHGRPPPDPRHPRGEASTSTAPAECRVPRGPVGVRRASTRSKPGRRQALTSATSPAPPAGGPCEQLHGSVRSVSTCRISGRPGPGLTAHRRRSDSTCRSFPTAPAQNPALLASAPWHQHRADAERQPPVVAAARVQLRRRGRGHDLSPWRHRPVLRPAHLPLFQQRFETTAAPPRCRGDDVPAFTDDPARQPTSCLSTPPLVDERDLLRSVVQVSPQSPPVAGQRRALP